MFAGRTDKFARLPSRSSTRSRRRKRSARQGTRLGVELLEDRRLLAVFTVNTRFDVVDANDQLVSLREAITAANDEGANPGATRSISTPL